MSVKIVVLASVLAVGGVIYWKSDRGDATVFPTSRDQAQELLLSAKTLLPRRDGDGQIRLWSTGRTAKGVALNLQYASWAPVLKCEAAITAIAPDRTRVVPDCGGTPDSPSAMVRTQEALRVPMFEEHIQATLGKRAFNRANADRKESAVVFGNLGGMQREAFRTASEVQRLEAPAQAQARR